MLRYPVVYRNGAIYMTGLDIGIVIAYFVIIIGVGIYASRKANTQENYMVAGHRMGFWVTFACLSAVLLGGTSTIGTTGLGWQNGISGMWLVTMLGIGLALVGVLLYKRIREEDVLTVAELLTKKFGPTAGILTAVVSAIYTMMVCATQIIAMGTILQSLAGWEPTLSMLVVGVIVVIYTILGGMWAITLTDLIQFFLIAAGILFIMLPFSLNAAGGMEALQANLPAEFWNLGNIGMDTIIQYFLLYLLGALVGQDLWQRYLTAKNVTVARSAGIASGVFIVIYGAACALIGMAALVYFNANGIEVDSRQLVFATMANEVLPTGALGVVLAAVLAVLMSTASGTLLASSSLLTNDVFKPLSVYRRTRSGEAALEAVPSDHTMLRASRRMTAVIGVFAIIVAVALNDVIVALDVSYAILSGALFFPIILALFWQKATPHAAIISIAASTIAIFVGMAVLGVEALEPIMIGLAISLILMVGITLFENRNGAVPPLGEGGVAEVSPSSEGSAAAVAPSGEGSVSDTSSPNQNA